MDTVDSWEKTHTLSSDNVLSKLFSENCKRKGFGLSTEKIQTELKGVGEWSLIRWSTNIRVQEERARGTYHGLHVLTLWESICVDLLLLECVNIMVIILMEAGIQ